MSTQSEVANIRAGDGEFLSYIFKLSNGQAFDMVRMLFGDWVNVLFGGDSNGVPTVLTSVVSYMNLIAIVFCVVVCAYVTLASVVKTATEGEILGSRWSQSWILIRMVSAISLMLPLPAGLLGVNVSLIQIIVLWVGMVGSNGADYMWRYAVANLIYNEVSVKTTSLGGKISADMLKIIYCASGMAKAKEIRTGDAFEIPIYTTNDYGVRTRFAGGMKDLGAIDSSVRRITFGPVTQSCGYIEVDGDINDNLEAGSLRGIAQKSLLTMMSDLYKNVYTPLDKPNYSAATLRTYLIEGERQDSAALSEAISNYDQILNNQRTQIKESLLNYAKGDITQSKNISSVSKLLGSWVFAGSFYNYFDERVVSHSRGMNLINGAVTFSSPDICSIEVVTARMTGSGWFGSSNTSEETCYSQQEYDKVNVLLTAFGNSKNTKGRGRTSTSTDVDISMNCQSEESCDTKSTMQAFAESLNPTSTVASWASTGIMNSVAYLGSLSLFGLGADVSDVDGDQIGFEHLQDDGSLKMGNAIATISAMGRSIVGTVVTGAALVGYLNIAKGGLDGVADSIVGKLGMSVPSKVLASSIVNLMTLLITIMMMVMPFAVQCAYLVPLLPAIIWISVVVGWVILLVEAMAAAPLAVVQMATPEGEGITGSRMERAIALIAALMLRPSLSIVGLIASMFVVNIAFMLANVILMVSSFSIVGGFDLFGMAVLICIWATTCVAAVKEAMKIIPTLGNDILDWFSNGVARSFGGHMSAEASAGFNRNTLTEVSGALRHARAESRRSKYSRAGRGGKNNKE